MRSLQILLLVGMALAIPAPSGTFGTCLDKTTGEPYDCPPPAPIPDNTNAYSCNPPIVDAANTPLPYTFKNPTPDQTAVNRRIEKVMGRGECSIQSPDLQTVYSAFGPYLVSPYPPSRYYGSNNVVFEGRKRCVVSCIDATDQPTIDWCNTNGCPIVGIDEDIVYFSPDGIIEYDGVMLDYSEYPCKNRYLSAVSAGQCPVKEALDLGAQRYCGQKCFSSLG